MSLSHSLDDNCFPFSKIYDCIQAGLNTLVGWGLKMFMKVLGLVSYMEKMISDPSEPTFVIRVCQICTIPKL